MKIRYQIFFNLNFEFLNNFFFHVALFNICPWYILGLLAPKVLFNGHWPKMTIPMIHPSNPFPSLRIAPNELDMAERWKGRNRKKDKRWKDEKVTGAKFILDDLVFFSMESKWIMNERPVTRNCTFAMVGLLYKVKDSIVKIAFVDNEEINEYLWNKTRQGQSQ